MQPSEIELIQRAAQGDPEAFTDFFDLYFQRVYQFTLWLSNDPDLAEDLTQETFIRAHANLPKLRPPWNARPWLFRMARNLHIDHHRRKQPQQALDAEAPLVSGEPGPERQVIQTQQAGAVQLAMQRLIPNYREALVLREIEGLHYDEIAEVLGVSLDSIKVLIHRARLSFKDHYGVRLLTEDPLPDCEILNELLDEFCDGECLEAQERAVRAHLRDCASCQQRTRELAGLVALFNAQPRPEPSRDLRRKVLGKITRRRSPRRMLIIAGVVIVLLLLGGGALAAGGGFETSHEPVVLATDEPSATLLMILPDTATERATPTDTPTATLNGPLVPAEATTQPQGQPVTEVVSGVTPTVPTDVPGGQPTLEGADGSLCGDNICQSGESADWCGDCTSGGPTPNGGTTGGGGSGGQPAVCGNGVLEAGEACEFDSDCVGNPAGNSCFAGCFCGPG